jgi:LPXTG-motif cell wall-anchored protein
MKMYKKYKIGTIFFMILFLSIGISLSFWQVTVRANDLEIVGSDKGLIFTSVGEKIFDVGNMNPGQRVKSKVTIKNTTKSPFELYLRIERLTSVPNEGEPDLYKQIQLTVTYRGEVIYKGTLYGFANTENGISLGYFAPGEFSNLIAEIYLPGAETGNEFQGKNIENRWIFSALSKVEEKPDDDIEVEELPETGNLPKTGSTTNALYIVSGLLFILVGKTLFGERKKQNTSAKKK